ncbi:MAG: LamG-like jellyroll fold domain-containing protein [Pirellulales bacterium]
MSVAITRTSGTAKIQDNAASATFGAGDFVSMGGWFKVSDITDLTGLLALGEFLGSTSGSIYLVNKDSVAGLAQAILRSSAGTVYGILNGTTVLSNDTWFHLVEVVDVDGTDSWLYVNGILEATDSSTTGMPITPLDQWRIGNRPDDNNNYWMDGKAAEVFIYQGDIRAVPGALGANGDILTKQARFVLDGGNLSHYSPLYDVLNPSDAIATTWVQSTTGDGAISMDAADHPVSISTISWSLAVIPDTQNYSQASATKNQQLQDQTDWIVANKAKKAIALAAHVGDITANNAASEWLVVEPRINDTFVAGNMEYVMVTGNHDMDGATMDRPSELVNTYFSPPTATGMVVKDANDIRNTYTRITMPDGIDYMFLCLEWRPDDTTLDWASGVLVANPGDKVIVVTHENLWEGLLQDANGHANAVRSAPTSSSTAGQDLWDRFTSKHDNIVMVLSGHAVFIGGQTDDDQEGSFGWMNTPSLHEANPKGRIVHDLTYNSQDNQYNAGIASGGGWMRLYEFNTDGTVTVNSLTTEDTPETYMQEANNNYTFTLDQMSGLPVDIVNGLVFHAKFDELSGSPVDETGSTTMTVEAGLTTTQGVASLIPSDPGGKAITFAGNGRVTLDTPLEIASVGGDMSLSAFIDIDIVDSSVSYIVYGTNIDGWRFNDGAADTMGFVINGTVMRGQFSSNFLEDTTYFIGVTRDGFTGEIVFYRGIPGGTMEVVVTQDLDPNARRLKDWDMDTIGGRDTLVNDLDATLDDFRAYKDRILNLTEMTQLMNSPFFVPGGSGARLGISLGL